MSWVWWLLAELMVVVGFACAIVIITERRQPRATLAWLLLIALAPYVGVPLYFLIGGRRIKRVTARKRSPVLDACRDHDEEVQELLSPRARNVASLMMRSGASAPRTGNRIRIINDGLTAYETLMEMLDGARHSIEVCTYILGRDEVGRAIVQKLAQKASQGVLVRLLVDGVGSWRTKGRFLQPLRDAGGRTGTFLRVLPIRRKASAHLRNHRKIVVVDKRAALVGGMNLSQEFIGPPSRRRRRWRDACAYIEGSAVDDLREVFDADWAFATEENTQEQPDREDAPTGDADRPQGTAIIQIVPDGPDIPEDPIYSAVTAAISQASRRIWIVSPFYIPDEAFATNLTLAARMGRDVRLILPRRSNLFLVDLAGRSYLDSLMAANAKVYLFEKGWLHAKMLVVDETLAAIGSFNMDVRSFHLNFEIGAFFYEKESIKAIAQSIYSIQRESKLLDREKFARRNRAVRFLEDTCRLFSPLL